MDPKVSDILLKTFVPYYAGVHKQQWIEFVEIFTHIVTQRDCIRVFFSGIYCQNLHYLTLWFPRTKVFH